METHSVYSCFQLSVAVKGTHREGLCMKLNVPRAGLILGSERTCGTGVLINRANHLLPPGPLHSRLAPAPAPRGHPGFQPHWLAWEEFELGVSGILREGHFVRFYVPVL